MRLHLLSCIAAAATLAFSSFAQAAPLYTVWQLEPIGEVGELEVSEGDIFLQQRLVPFEMVRLTEAAEWKRNKVLVAGTILFAVYQSDGQTAYCTIKDQSNSNAARSLFIPALDKRPCLFDQNEDGIFDEYFTVFDKYGSALTPSGNLSSVKPMHGRASYETASSSDFPEERRLAYSLTGLNDSENRSISVNYDNGRGFVAMSNEAPRSTPDSPAALNLVAHILSVDGNRARLRLSLDPNIVIVGDSDGTFGGMPLPAFAR